jgi:hypothetical protein
MFHYFAATLMMSGLVSLCSFCEEIPTRHRCMHSVKKGGIIMVGVGGHVCGQLICAPCSSSFGNEEGVFHCLDHLESATLDDEDKENEQGGALEAIAVHERKKKSKVTSKTSKTSEYSAKDLLILSQVFIWVSENAIEGADKKRNKFWDEVAVAFNQLKKQQESYDNQVQKKNKYNQVLMRGEFLSSDEDGNSECVLPPRTASSLQQKWSKSVLPLVTKFISLTNRFPMESDEGKLSHCIVQL